MAVDIPKSHLDLFEKKAFAHLATLMPDGSPQSTPVWVEFDGENVVINTAKGRQKERNVTIDPRVALSIVDPDDPYRYIEVRGRVVELTDVEADEHLDQLSQRYLGRNYPGDTSEEHRIVVRIRPEQVSLR